MIRLGIIGLGQAAQILHLPNLEKLTDAFQLTAVADISAEPLRRRSRGVCHRRIGGRQARFH